MPSRVTTWIDWTTKAPGQMRSMMPGTGGLPVPNRCATAWGTEGRHAAIAHWQTLASPEHQAEIVWMALRHEIDYKAQAVEGDEIIVRTWIGTAEGLRFERFTEMLRNGDRKLLVQARTVWCPIDPKSGRPKRVGAEVYRLFSRPNPL